MIIYKCDKCGKTEDGQRGQRTESVPDGWYELIHGQYFSGVKYHVCPECRKALGIPDNYLKADAHVGDQLIELIEEIVCEAVQNQ